MTLSEMPFNISITRFARSLQEDHYEGRDKADFQEANVLCRSSYDLHELRNSRTRREYLKQLQPSSTYPLYTLFLHVASRVYQ